jgi:Zn-dependent peptidase ImmA (M78 family)/transcriptional regulator with XRE-family HTH domain
MRLNQVELGQRVGVTRQAISAYEHGDKMPEPDTFNRLASELGQPPAFFTSEDRPTFGEFRPRFFRKRGPETIRRNEACAVLGAWFAQIARYLDRFVNYPPVNVPNASPSESTGRYSQDEIDEIADSCRSHWGLGVGPISNVLALLEANGIAVCRYELEGESVDAFSFWNGERPFIFMASEEISGVRVRYDLAHELAHLILHRWVEGSELEDPKVLKAIEAEADRFAGAILLPRKSFPNEVYTPRLEAFIALKRRWLVSIQAMIYRCRDLDLIDADQSLNLYKQISYRKWRKREPLDDPSDIAIEQPRLLKRAVELVVNARRKHPDEILNDLCLNPSLIESFCNLSPGTLAPPALEVFEPTLK